MSQDNITLTEKPARIVPMRGLRVEEPAAQPSPTAPSAAPQPPPKPAETHDVDYWRRMAVNTGERLAIAENQLKDLRTAADDGRARMGKYKQRSDAASARVNDLQIALVSVSAERDALRSQLATQEMVARKVHEYRESLLHGPLWELFAELAVCPPEKAGEESA